MAWRGSASVGVCFPRSPLTRKQRRTAWPRSQNNISSGALRAAAAYLGRAGSRPTILVRDPAAVGFSRYTRVLHCGSHQGREATGYWPLARLSRPPKTHHQHHRLAHQHHLLHHPFGILVDARQRLLPSTLVAVAVPHFLTQQGADVCQDSVDVAGDYTTTQYILALRKQLLLPLDSLAIPESAP